MSQHPLSLQSARQLCPATDIGFKTPDPLSQRWGIISRCTMCLHGTIGLCAEIRRRKDGRGAYLAFPRERSQKGRMHSLIWPRDPLVHEAIELQVFEAARALGLALKRYEPGAA